MKHAIDFLKQLNIKKEDYVVVACSGGSDSMALMYLLNNFGYKVVCSHVNHNLRKVSDEEYKFVENYCKNNNIIFEGMKIKKYKNNKFSENEARKKRYSFFEEILKKYNSSYLFTAHHGDDLVETILMRLIRGSSLNGYKGFSKMSQYKNFYIIRPLVFYTKKEIISYVEKMDIPYVSDESNFSRNYTRNRIRLDILPSLKKENENVHIKFLNFNTEIEKAYNFINEEVKEHIKQNFNIDKLELDLIKFKKINSYIQEKELEEILNIVYKENITCINKNHLEQLTKLINKDGNKVLNFPNNIQVLKTYDKLEFNTENKINEDYYYELKDEIDIPLGKIKYIKDIECKSNYILKLNSRDIKLPLIIRNKRDNDYMYVKNLKGKKSIKKIFIDEKININFRKLWPIVTDSDNNILWIPGLKKSEFDCCDTGFYDIIVKYEKKGE